MNSGVGLVSSEWSPPQLYMSVMTRGGREPYQSVLGAIGKKYLHFWVCVKCHRVVDDLWRLLRVYHCIPLHNDSVIPLWSPAKY